MPAIWRKLVKLAGLERVRLHDCRHGFASFAVADGDPLYLAGKVLGHAQASTTQRYAHLQLDPVRAVADRTSRRPTADGRARWWEWGQGIELSGQAKWPLGKSDHNGAIVVAASGAGAGNVRRARGFVFKGAVGRELA